MHSVPLLLLTAFLLALPLLLKALNKQKKDAIDLPAENKGESCIRRSNLSPTLIKTLHPSVTTMFCILNVATENFPTKQQFGTRTLIKTHTEQKTIKKGTSTETKTWTYPELSSYTFMTYTEIKAKCLSIGSGLVKSKVGKSLAIFAPTSREWSLVAHSCWSQNIAIVTAYDSLGPEGLAHALNEGKLTSLFTSTDLFKTVRKVIPLVATLKLVIYMGESDEVSEIKSEFSGVKFMSLEEVFLVGKEFNVSPNPPKPSDNACIMYTSGSTGKSYITFFDF